MLLSNKVYDILVWVVQVILPAVGTLYFTLSQIWGLPYGEQIVGTITAVATCLGAILKISNAKYKKDISERNNHLNAIK
ncbi:MAG: phage holin [Clostridiales bacterium]|nr:phage holin [Clostridiales bacterium]